MEALTKVVRDMNEGKKDAVVVFVLFAKLVFAREKYDYVKQQEEMTLRLDKMCRGEYGELWSAAKLLWPRYCQQTRTHTMRGEELEPWNW